MEYLPLNISLKIKKTDETLITFTDITEKIININKENQHTVSDMLNQFLKGKTDNDTIQYISYIIYLTTIIRPRSRNSIASLISLLLRVIPSFNHYFDNFRLLKDIMDVTDLTMSTEKADILSIDLYDDSSIEKSIFNDDTDIFEKRLLMESYVLISSSLNPFHLFDDMKINLIEMAAFHGSIKCFKFFMLNGMDINEKNN